MINARGELEVYSPDIFLSDRAAVKLANEICFSGRLALQLKLTGPRLSKSQRNRLS
jgi:hypothetical protein